MDATDVETPAKHRGSWIPGLRGRVAMTMVAAVAVACGALTIITTQWSEAQYRESRDKVLSDVIWSDVQNIANALEVDPTASTFDELVAAGMRLHVTTGEGEPLIAAIPHDVFEVDPEDVMQWVIVSFDTPLSERAPECVTPRELEQHVATSMPQPGVGLYWIEECGDYLMGYGYLFGPLDADTGELGTSWLAARALYLPGFAESSPTPELRDTLLQVSAGVIVAAAILALLVASSAIRPVRKAGEMASAVASGDLSVRIPVKGNDAVAKMSTAVNTMADRLTGQIAELERANEMQRRFVSDVAHELRTPTSALLASAEALKNPETRDEAAVLVVPQLGRLAALTEDLLEISRMDAGRAELMTAHIDVVDLIAEVIAGTGAIYTGPDELPLSTDPVRMQAVLRNLVSNAIQHGAPPITVALAVRDSGITIDVSDGGGGVPEGLRERVFDRFVRGDESRHGSSSGLGLVIAAENAALLGGTLALLPQGTTFRFAMPHARPDQTATMST